MVTFISYTVSHLQRFTFKVSAGYRGSVVCASFHPCEQQLQVFLSIKMGGGFGLFSSSCPVIIFYTFGTHATVNTWRSKDNSQKALVLTVWVGGIELRSSGLAGRAFTLWTVLLAYCHLAQVTEWELALSVDCILCRLLGRVSSCP